LGLIVSQKSKATLQGKIAEERLNELQEISLKKLPDSFDYTSSNNQEAVNSSSTEVNLSSNIELQAKEDANAAVGDAVEALKQVQQNLIQNGQSEAAASVN